MDGHAISFGPYRLLAARGAFCWRATSQCGSSSRAFDILAALVERAGEVVPQEELIARAWPQTIVEEADLKIQIRRFASCAR